MINRIFAFCVLTSLLSNFARANDQALQDCLGKAGEVAPDAEALALAVTGALTKDKFLHRAYISPMEYRMLDAKKIAEMLVARLYEECEVPRTAPDSETIDSEIVMMVPSKNLEAISHFGFQNQHTTGTTKGATAPNLRFNTEQNMAAMQLPYGAKMREVLPKYSVVNLKTGKLDRFPLPGTYGDTAVVFNSAVKKRTTFTFQDSLSMSAYYDGPTDRFPPRTAGFRLSATNDPSKSSQLQCSGYCEGQIWGPVDFSDVDRLLIKPGTKITEEMKRLGVPIYELKAPDMFDPTYSRPNFAPDQTAVFQQGRQLFAGGKVAARASLTTRKGLEIAIKGAQEGTPIKRILNNQLLGRLSNEELLSRFAEDSSDIKVFSELATRSLSPEIENLLVRERNNASSPIRRAALFGLSELPTEKFRPYLLESLKDQSEPVRLLAIALALDFKDPEVQAALEKLAKPKDENSKEYSADTWAYKLWKRKKYCAPD